MLVLFSCIYTKTGKKMIKNKKKYGKTEKIKKDRERKAEMHPKDLSSGQ